MLSESWKLYLNLCSKDDTCLHVIMTSNTGEREGLYSTTSKFLWRRNLLLVARYLLKFTFCALHVVKSLITHCKSFVTRCRSCSLQKIIFYLLQKLVVAKTHSLLVAKFARNSLQHITHYSLQNSLLTRCRSCSLWKITRYSLQNSLVTCCKNSLVTGCKILSFQKITRQSLQNWLVTRCNKSLVNH